MRVGVLTSSRADYSIYFPLLKALRAGKSIALEIIAFGTHLSELHGKTVTKIEEDGFSVNYRIQTVPDNDTPGSISRSMGETVSRFSALWGKEKFDLVFCLGDRYEMFAACASTVPFNIHLAHLHGGEKTLGAIDDVFRHAITHMSSYHFTAAEPYRKRVIELKGAPDHVYNVGALSIDNLKSLTPLSLDDFKKQFQIDLSIPSILITFHPETVAPEKNEFYIQELISALDMIKGYQYIFTMPNADTMGGKVRTAIQHFIARTPHSNGVESFGTIGYLSCMKHCSFMMGNTSSGFIEASFFPKYVINLGERQRGRLMTDNMVMCPIARQEIIHAVELFLKKSLPTKIRMYGNGNTAAAIMDVLNSIQ